MDMHAYRWMCMHIDGYACISMDMHAYSRICMHIHGYACLRDSSENTRTPLLRWFLMNCNYYKEKWKSRFSWEIEIPTIKTESNQCFHRKPDIILWSLRSFWVERFDLNQSLKIDFSIKSFLYQCKNSIRNRLSPRSRLGQMTYRKLKPHPSWHLLHAPFNLFCIFLVNN